MGRIYLSLFLLLILWGLKQELLAQPFCATDEVHRHLLRTNPVYKTNIELQDAKWRQYSRDITSRVKRPARTEDAFYEIPVVIHVIHTGQPVGSNNNPSDG